MEISSDLNMNGASKMIHTQKRGGRHIKKLLRARIERRFEN